MLRQYTFVFLLFLLTFSAFLGGVSAQNDIQSEIENARQKGYSDEEIRQALKNATWTEAQIDKLLSTSQSETEQEQGEEYDPENVQQWNLPEGAIRRIGKGEASDVTYAPDGQRLAVAGSIGIWIYDARTLTPLKLIAGDTSRKVRSDGSVWARSVWINSVSFSPDGKTIVSGGSGGMDKILRLWDVNTGSLLKTFKGHTIWVNSVRFSPDGKTIVSGGSDKTIHLWDAETGGNIQTFKGHTGSVNSVRFSPDGQTIASGSEDGTVRLWDVKTGRQVKALKGHTNHVRIVSFSSDGQTIASGSSDKTVRLWDTETGEQIQTLTGHKWGIRSVIFSPDGQTIASGSSDKTVRLWDTETGKQIQTLIGHKRGVGKVSFSPDSSMLTSGSLDGTILVWDVRTFEAAKLTR